MPILILGGRGNLGTQLTKLFSEDYITVSLGREDLDVLDFSALASKIRELKPELIINAVAFNAVDKCEDKEGYQRAFQLNVRLPEALAELALEIGSVLMHYSTDYVFSGTEDKQSFSEDDTPNPINKYGETKFQGEREILRRQPSGLRHYIIRTSKLFGPAGISPNAKASFFDVMLDLAEQKKELPVVNEELSCFTYTPDLAAASRRLWETDAPYGIYHLTNGGAVNWYEVAVELFHQKRMTVSLRPVRSENLFRPARRPKFSVLQNTKTHKLRNWKEALKDYLDL